MSLGPVMLDIAGTELDATERERLAHPLVGGVILFARNFVDPDQLAALVAEIHAVRDPQLLVAVDQEGGRVQRFRDGFTLLPAPRRFGEVHDGDPERARQLAYDSAWVMARELRSVGVDFSFAPVLDLDYGVSGVIGDRALHSEPAVVEELGQSFVHGMRAAGMAAVGKHYPGHGGIAADSHHEVPEDPRTLEALRARDLRPFAHLAGNGLPAVMPAHVIYPEVDRLPAGFSHFWLQTVLREWLGFQGLIFSDDLAMAGAAVAGSPLERARAARAAGCDVILHCNDIAGADAILEGLEHTEDPLAHVRLARMHGRHAVARGELARDPDWRSAVHRLAALAEDPTGDLALEGGGPA